MEVVCQWYCLVAVAVAASISEVKQHRARLVPGWVTVHGSNPPPSKPSLSSLLVDELVRAAASAVFGLITIQPAWEARFAASVSA